MGRNGLNRGTHVTAMDRAPCRKIPMPRRMQSLFTLMLVLLVTAAAQAAYKPVKLDRVHSKIGFTASTLLFDVDGQFKDYTVAVEGTVDDLSKAKVQLEIDASSIDTDNKKRDEHLRSPDFFDVAKYPTIRFVSERITERGNTLEVTGTLEMHGVSSKVTIPFKKIVGKNGAGIETTVFKGKLTLNRNAFGVGSDSIAAKLSLEEEVSIDLLLAAFL